MLLHPAKYPETLVAEFVERFTQPGELVLDPMAGTGSTLLACRRIGRRGIGVELNPEYAAIARRRLAEGPCAASGERGSTPATQSVVVGDALRLAAVEGVCRAQVDYCITSPPYWDMLNMRGAMTQRGRRQRGLHVSYGDDPRDVGNVAEYGQFVDSLVRVYRQVAARLRPGGYLTVIVKNVKKQGLVYPLAWDLAAALAEFSTGVSGAYLVPRRREAGAVWLRQRLGQQHRPPLLPDLPQDLVTHPTGSARAGAAVRCPRQQPPGYDIPWKTRQDTMLTVSVENFGPIREGTVELRPLTVFVGAEQLGQVVYGNAHLCESLEHWLPTRIVGRKMDAPIP